MTTYITAQINNVITLGTSLDVLNAITDDKLVLLAQSDLMVMSEAIEALMANSILNKTTNANQITDLLTRADYIKADLENATGFNWLALIVIRFWRSWTNKETLTHVRQEFASTMDSLQEAQKKALSGFKDAIQYDDHQSFYANLLLRPERTLGRMMTQQSSLTSQTSDLQQKSHTLQRTYTNLSVSEREQKEALQALLTEQSRLEGCLEEELRELEHDFPSHDEVGACKRMIQNDYRQIGNVETEIDAIERELHNLEQDEASDQILQDVRNDLDSAIYDITREQLVLKELEKLLEEQKTELRESTVTLSTAREKLVNDLQEYNTAAEQVRVRLIQYTQWLNESTRNEQESQRVINAVRQFDAFLQTRWEELEQQRSDIENLEQKQSDIEERLTNTTTSIRDQTLTLKETQKTYKRKLRSIDQLEQRHQQLVELQGNLLSKVAIDENRLTAVITRLREEESPARCRELALQQERNENLISITYSEIARLRTAQTENTSEWTDVTEELTSKCDELEVVSKTMGLALIFFMPSSIDDIQTDETGVLQDQTHQQLMKNLRLIISQQNPHHLGIRSHFSVIDDLSVLVGNNIGSLIVEDTHTPVDEELVDESLSTAEGEGDSPTTVFGVSESNIL